MKFLAAFLALLSITHHITSLTQPSHHAAKKYSVCIAKIDFKIENREKIWLSVKWNVKVILVGAALEKSIYELFTVIWCVLVSEWGVKTVRIGVLPRVCFNIIFGRQCWRSLLTEFVCTTPFLEQNNRISREGKKRSNFTLKSFKIIVFDIVFCHNDKTWEVGKYIVARKRMLSILFVSHVLFCSIFMENYLPFFDIIKSVMILALWNFDDFIRVPLFKPIIKS